jgi:hypothetical protein
MGGRARLRLKRGNPAALRPSLPRQPKSGLLGFQLFGLYLESTLGHGFQGKLSLLGGSGRGTPGEANARHIHRE